MPALRISEEGNSARTFGGHMQDSDMYMDGLVLVCGGGRTYRPGSVEEGTKAATVAIPRVVPCTAAGTGGSLLSVASTSTTIDLVSSHVAPSTSYVVM
ncbi:hypothetical protein, variant 1 [Aphanomyces astaci]|uniref:Uncharacterized protein n=1 Tax=Aphanomyces astaci TaxID=112090 RepID=W4FH12_APHAT|nr:hypothetical protein H257_16885 [Aphanomyces astaci]XP_009843795.1 hypothetical protein, variant 1 [Aphanomyces astaci]ETV66817.1 hypothetical protein H257_16885 [Aphanomyces astaci]ETV66818.1 hypothetical protein, variant 1 [Aphanomyces astaci]|eukprot:XP_009843793.1 hypothetical protein H257_16885 [Aphanomyces astaci]